MPIMFPTVLALLVGSLAVPALARVAGRATGWILALVVGGAGVLILRQGFRTPAVEVVPWLGDLGVHLALRQDGLAATFVLLVAGIGALVLLYGDGYLHGSALRARVLALLTAFLAAMLGLVLSDDLITLFVFWELTSITSYLLIGVKHQDESSRSAARQALLVTGAGGIALLVGLILLARIGMDAGLAVDEAWRVSSLLTIDPRAHALYPAALALILLGAFTKSAQVPFHFWLPAAMAAPTPVSALLHSATMVKAGVFLLARLHPIMGGTTAWVWTVTAVGMATMFYAAVVAVRQRDLKKVLAWSTVAVLGVLTMLLGLGTKKAVEAAVVFLVAHALYKAALFMVAGNVDHGAGTRDLAHLGGLRRLLPWTAAAGAVAALSKAGAPPMFGFVGKELLYKAKVDLDGITALLVLVAVLANVALVAAALLVGVRPFWGRLREKLEDAHEVPWSMRVGPLVLASAGIFIGLVPAAFDRGLGSAMASSILAKPVAMELKLWHGVDPTALTVLALSIATLMAGAAVFTRRRGGLTATTGPMPDTPLFAGRVFERWLLALYAGAGVFTRVLHTGSLRRYVLLTVGVSLALLATVLLGNGLPNLSVPFHAPELHEWFVLLLIVGGALHAATTRSRLAGVAAVGVSGAGVALVFLFFGAPDLAITQIMVETLTVVLFVLVFYRMAPFVQRSRSWTRMRDAFVATAMGAVVTVSLLAVAAVPDGATVSDEHVARSVVEAFGRNVVNVILVDFRALDTLGEVIVVACAGLGVYALVRSGRSAGRA